MQYMLLPSVANCDLSIKRLEATNLKDAKKETLRLINQYGNIYNSILEVQQEVLVYKERFEAEEEFEEFLRLKAKFEPKCNTCNGIGFFHLLNHSIGQDDKIICNVCNGTGFKKISC